MKKFFFIFGMFLAASCHSGDINVDIALDSDIYEENDWIYLFVQYGNQLALIDSCRITDGRALFRGKIPQKEVLAEIMIPNKTSHILLVAEGENIKLRVNKQTRSFFPMCEGSYATKRIAEIARRYREIGYKIAYCRKHMNLTQEELAEKVGVSRQHIGAIEAPNVDRKVSLDLIFSIAELCNVEPGWFLQYDFQQFAGGDKK